MRHYESLALADMRIDFRSMKANDRPCPATARRPGESVSPSAGAADADGSIMWCCARFGATKQRQTEGTLFTCGLWYNTTTSSINDVVQRRELIIRVTKEVFAPDKRALSSRSATRGLLVLATLNNGRLAGRRRLLLLSAQSRLHSRSTRRGR
ncbi:hypothetical protein EVAR_87929_1 [Eumeta japonica]|uniref:Uncharacterized protein n=1 Tax=Eumeta variegata TaxID=151549 RepID=A0A4C1WXQ4_EUMVA|nr:hypothetical protein EVAR_87929_1 [Eumeta japonica]